MSQHQRHQEQLAKGPRLAEHYVSKLSPESDKNHEDHTNEEVEKLEKLANSRLNRELPDTKLQKATENSLDEIFWIPSVQGDLPDCHQPYSSASSPLENQLMCPALDVASSIQATYPQEMWSGDLSHRLSEVQVSQTQLEASTLVPSCLSIELDQVFHCGSGSASQSLSSNTCSFTVNVNSNSPLLHYGFLPNQSRPNSLVQTHAVLPTFPGDQSQSQDTKLVISPSIVIKNPPQMEDDTLKAQLTTHKEINSL
ncbi:hypothetical protein P7K49_014402 [Saguinus oedipus]|uniref:Olduvai domain-containing protein n=1 Tax=Saguinus oedipus TaxID=9490 RepID=A0ABQ9VLS9_SAGOE|nr:hypothetical protein P7K49_014399 [Saguinus oedipus]KAK2109237.1 hypothetical protein P7K49_014402 [Saguinus oedipus]